MMFNSFQDFIDNAGKYDSEKPIGRTSDIFDLNWVCEILDQLYLEYQLDDYCHNNLLDSLLER